MHQVDRVLLLSQVRSIAPEVVGAVADVGGANQRYWSLFRDAKSIVSMDINAGDIVFDINSSVPRALECKFDTVTCFQVLNDSLDPLVAARNLLDLCKPGGLIVLTEGFFDPIHDCPDRQRLTLTGVLDLFLKSEACCEVVRFSVRGNWLDVIGQICARKMITHFGYHPPNYCVRVICRILSRLIVLLCPKKISENTEDQEGAVYLGYMLVLRKV
jgi:SAM-dependent methyltransferase